MLDFVTELNSLSIKDAYVKMVSVPVVFISLHYSSRIMPKICNQREE